ncbi:T9SS type A sorting domain-containing protein [Aliifodinibius sp. S!AR15-10]|uniref:MXAN_6640 family putative metalloprotease n=1 Tax=Aliifodinibius sp. S!AR15-10 TaxID=2950437 RepID=UPI002866E952|nr:MXAN_6640 family putative metalloprotease [Aliifodinibius sp. S!AR15-10]MDR8394153.1 T9SS type A sorting domain-containing protein [Aliifodinibius sp. S!AR15-10]
MIHNHKIFIGLVSTFLFFTSSSIAQQTLYGEQPNSQETLRAIQSTYLDGEISLEQKVLYQLYAGLDVKALPSTYKTHQTAPIKCGLPAIREYQGNKDQLSQATIDKVQAILRRSTQAQETYRSPSGKFEIHYDVSGANAVPAGDTNPSNGIPDYVDWAAAAADSSWRHQIQRLGYTDPVDGSNPYPIYIENINSYGYTDYGYNRGLSTDTYIVIHKNYDDFPENDDPEGNQKGALKVTIAHELKHAIQYANSEWYGWPENPESPHGTDWSEMDATMMEEVVYDNVNDYYNYIGEGGSSLFVSNNHSIPVAYDGVTWFIYFWERYGEEFWPGVWSRIQQQFQQQRNRTNPDYLTMKGAITQTLQEEYEDSFEIAFAESHLWHYASGINYSRDGYGFNESANYPSPTINSRLTARDIFENDSVLAMGAKYITVDKESDLQGYLKMLAEYQDQDIQIGLIGFYDDGSVDTIIRKGDIHSGFKLTTPWNWEAITHAGIVVTNSGKSELLGYNLAFSPFASDGTEVAQNYPNPFNPTTTIEFGLLQQSHVQLSVYNVAGQKVSTLKDEILPAGVYEVPFDGRNLASGVYFYRLVTDQRVIVKKMTLIK